MKKRGSCASVCALLILVSSCSESAPAEATREERIERTTALLLPVLFDDAAREQAEIYVDMCAAYPEEMYHEARRAIDPRGQQRFNSLAEAYASPTSGATGLDISGAACTSAELVRVWGFGNI